MREIGHHGSVPDHLHNELAQIPLTGPTPVYPNVNAHDHSRIHLGDVYHMYQPQEPKAKQSYGLCWGSAPLIDADQFIGRLSELDQMARALQPGETTREQRRVVVGGLGGMGKTQLAIAYARRMQHQYDSVFWLNATSISTLRASIRSVAQCFLSVAELQPLNDEEVLSTVFHWLSDTRNLSWLLIFDNYDDPALYSLEQYLPNTGHGSVIVTSRLPNLIQGQWMQQVRISAITNLEESLEILQTRSQRVNTQHDPDARKLIKRLAGLPLALATAGAYLRKTTMSFGQYLEAYERRFNIHPRRPTQLQEYQDRTLYTTWNLSYSQLENDDKLAALLLRLLAYFDNQQIWYELLRAGLGQRAPPWLYHVAAEHIDFENTLGILVEYCLVEAHPATRSYSMHNCVHDWTLETLNREIDWPLYWYTFDCVAASIDREDWDGLGNIRFIPISRHGARLAHHRFQQHDAELKAGFSTRFSKLEWIANLLVSQSQYSAAGLLYRRILTMEEANFGLSGERTLSTVHNIGLVNLRQWKLDEAEQMFRRALVGLEKLLGPEDRRTLDTVQELASLYCQREIYNEAENMYLRALAGRKKVLGPAHRDTIDSVFNLSVMYLRQGKLPQAEHMGVRALTGYEEAVGPDHVLTAKAAHNLSKILLNQDKLDEAEQMSARALMGCEKAFGPDYSSTLSVLEHLAKVYQKQGRVDEAEEMFARARAAREKNSS